MRPYEDFLSPTTDERFREIASIFAGVILRLRARAALSPAPDASSDTKNPTKSGPNGLELPGDPRLSVQTG